MSLFAFITLLSLVLGIWMFVHGRRGRRIDDHPICARCKFDLSGRPKDSWKCPECGVSLVFESAIQIGNRRRREGLMYTGLAMALLATLILVSSMAVVVMDVDTIRFKPAWWLLYDAAHDPHPSPQSSDVAELLYRVKNSRLSPAEQQNMIDLALKLQADPGKPWNPSWGDMIEWLNNRGLVRVPDWNKYLSQDEPATLEVRPHVASGDPIPWRLHGELRGSTPLTAYRSARPSIISSIPGGVSQYPAWAGWGGGWGGNTFSFSGSILLTAASWNQLKPGSQSIIVTASGVAGASASNPTLFAPITLTANWTMLNPGEKSVTLYHDDAMAELVGRSLTLACHTNSIAPNIGLAISFERPPISVAYGVSIKFGGKELNPNLYGIRALKNVQADVNSCIYALAPEMSGHHVDVIIRPSCSAAGGTVDIDRLLDHEYVFKDFLLEEGNKANGSMK